MKFHYLSHGKYITGGFLHEKFYAESLLAYLNENGIEVEYKQIRENRFFENPIAYFGMLKKALVHANADLNLMVSRYALPALFRALTGKGKYIVVFHYEDKNDNQSLFLKDYFKLFFFLLNQFCPNNLAILTVAPFWVNYFRQKLPGTHILYFPNLIDLHEIKSISTNKNQKLIHLGQWSWKNDKSIFELASNLNKIGYDCYFSSNNPDEAGQFEDYKIIAEGRTEYLTRMASATYTIAFTSIHEGWNRLAHESILLGTPVIGFDKGGLGDLLKESNSFIVSNHEQAYQIILDKKIQEPDELFKLKYSITQAKVFLQSTLNFIQK